MNRDSKNSRKHWAPELAIKFLKRSWIIATFVAGVVTSGWAQSPATDIDNWVQFPPRPRTNSAQPTPIAESSPPVQEPDFRPSPTVVSTTNERDNWLRFPIRPTAPVAVDPIPTKETTTSTAYVPNSKQNEVSSTAKRFVGFKLSGNQRITQGAIQEELRPFIGQTLTQENLLKVTEKVTTLYQSSGFLAVAEMPAQDLTSGWVEVKVVEATFSGAVMEDPQGQLANTRLPIALVERVQPKGTLISLSALDKAAALISEIPGVQTKLSLRPGDNAGETQAIATFMPGKTVEANVTIDNAGAKSTGELRETAKITLNNPLKIGDAVSAQVLRSDGLDFYKLGYSLPVGAAGWRAGFNSSAMKYKVVASGFESLNAKGPSSTYGVDLIIPLIRENLDSLSLQLAYDQKKFKNEALDTVQSNYSGNALSAYLEATHNNDEGGETSASLQLVKGGIDLSGSTLTHQLNDAATTQTDGPYRKLRLALTHKQDLDADNTLVGSVQSQWASKNLDGSERFYLGGLQGVRAYPTNEAGGSVGQLWSLEWQKHINLNQHKWTAAGFYDTGRVTVNKNNYFANGASPNNYSISGAGVWIGTSLVSAYGISTVRLVAAHRLGSNPGASNNGQDQDGTRVLTRYRLSLNHSY